MDDESQVSISGNQVTINLQSDLDPNTRYEIRVDDRALTDVAGNRFGGLSGSDTLDFETADDDSDDDDSDDDIEEQGITGEPSFPTNSGHLIEIVSAGEDEEDVDASTGLGSDDRVNMVAGALRSKLELDDPFVGTMDPAGLPQDFDDVVAPANDLALSSAFSDPMPIENIAPIIVTSQGLA